MFHYINLATVSDGSIKVKIGKDVLGYPEIKFQQENGGSVIICLPWDILEQLAKATNEIWQERLKKELKHLEYEKVEQQQESMAKG